MADEQVNELEPPEASIPEMTVVRVWPVREHWRWDVQHLGTPKSRWSGESLTENSALLSAVDELVRLAGRK